MVDSGRVGNVHEGLIESVDTPLHCDLHVPPLFFVSGELLLGRHQSPGTRHLRERTY